jgi:hypothetical protein
MDGSDFSLIDVQFAVKNVQLLSLDTDFYTI